MIERIGHITILVKDIDKAVKFYIEKLGFVKRSDTFFGPHMRWVTVSLKNQENLELTFVRADSKGKLRALGKQAGDHVFLTMETGDCRKDYKKMKTISVVQYHTIGARAEFR